MDSDLFLRWMSYRGHGSITDITSSVAALLEGLAHTKINASRAYLKRLETLGLLDLKWSESKWCIRPTVITQLPGSSAFALVTGKRTAELQNRLEESAALHSIEPAKQGALSPQDPKTLVLEYNSEFELRDIASIARAIFIPCAASSITANLPLLTLGPRSGGPNAYGSPVQKFSTFQEEFLPVEEFDSNGLFRQTVNGRFQYWLLKSRTWFSTSHAEGRCLVMSEKSTGYFRFRSLESADDPVGTLSIDTALTMPLQQRRALVLCSGFGPVRSPDGAWVYENVPSSIASAVARSVHQQLRVR